MSKGVIFVCTVVVIAYYAGTEGLTPGNVIDWFADNDILQSLKDKLSEILKFAEEQ